MHVHWLDLAAAVAGSSHTRALLKLEDRTTNAEDGRTQTVDEFRKDFCKTKEKNELFLTMPKAIGKRKEMKSLR